MQQRKYVLELDLNSATIIDFDAVIADMKYHKGKVSKPALVTIPAPPDLVLPPGTVIYHSQGWMKTLLDAWTISNSPMRADGIERTDYGDLSLFPLGSRNLLRFTAQNVFNSISFDGKVNGQVGLRLAYGANGSWSDLKALYGHVVAFPWTFYLPQLPTLESGENCFFEWGWQFKTPEPTAASEVSPVEGGIGFYQMVQHFQSVHPTDFPLIQARAWQQVTQRVYFHEDPAQGWAEIEFGGKTVRGSAQTMAADGGVGAMLVAYMNRAAAFTGYVGDTAIVDLGTP